MRILGKTKVEKDFKEIFFTELISITAGVIAGLFLSKLFDNIALSGLFILFPGLLEMHGNIYGSLSARLGNLLLLKKLKTKKDFGYFLKENLFAIFFQVLFISILLGLISYMFVYFIFGIDNKILILVSVLSSILSSFFEIPLTIYNTIWLYKHDFDPEDIMGPYITTLGDIISIVSLILISALII